VIYIFIAVPPWIQEPSILSSPLIVVLLALIGPAIPVLLSHIFTKRKLRKQDKVIEEIHVVVNSRFSAILDALRQALEENIILKIESGKPVPIEEQIMLTETKILQENIENKKDLPLKDSPDEGEKDKN